MSFSLYFGLHVHFFIFFGYEVTSCSHNVQDSFTQYLNSTSSLYHYKTTTKESFLGLRSQSTRKNVKRRTSSLVHLGLLVVDVMGLVVVFVVLVVAPLPVLVVVLVLVGVVVDLVLWLPLLLVLRLVAVLTLQRALSVTRFRTFLFIFLLEKRITY